MMYSIISSVGLIFISLRKIRECKDGDTMHSEILSRNRDLIEGSLKL